MPLFLAVFQVSAPKRRPVQVTQVAQEVGVPQQHLKLHPRILPKGFTFLRVIPGRPNGGPAGPCPEAKGAQTPRAPERLCVASDEFLDFPDSS